MSNALDPDLMTAADRLDEVAEILAAGILRLRERRAQKNLNKPNGLREVSLDLPPEKSVCRQEPKQTREGR